MNTNDDSGSIDAFVDGELELARRLELEARLRSDAGLARRVGEQRQLRHAIREGADYHVAPAALRERIRGTAGPPHTRRPRLLPGGGAAVRRWFGWRPLLASFGLATVVAAAVGGAVLRSWQVDRLRDEVVASHVRATLGGHLVDVASSDHHTVKPWLASKLDFSPPVDALAIPGSVFLGGRVDYLDGRPVAALVYRQGAHVVTAFVWPSSGAEARPVFGEDRGFRTARWTRRGMAHWAVSDVNRDEFDSVVEALRRAGADPAGP